MYIYYVGEENDSDFVDKTKFQQQWENAIKQIIEYLP